MQDCRAFHVNCTFIVFFHFILNHGLSAIPGTPPPNQQIFSGQPRKYKCLICDPIDLPVLLPFFVLFYAQNDNRKLTKIIVHNEAEVILVSYFC